MRFMQQKIGSTVGSTVGSIVGLSRVCRGSVVLGVFVHLEPHPSQPYLFAGQLRPDLLFGIHSHGATMPMSVADGAPTRAKKSAKHWQ